jgi:HSP20 family protein
MTDMTRYDPVGGMMSLRDAMNELLAESFVGRQGLLDRSHKPLDLYETEQQYVARVAVPGLKPEDFDITLQDNVLTINGQTKEEQVEENARYHLRERHFGSFSRSIRFPSGVDAANVQAELADGVLTVRVPKAEEAKPRRITVNARSQV